VEAQLALVKESAFPVDPRHGFDGMEKKIIRLAAHQERKKRRQKEKEFPAIGHGPSFLSHHTIQRKGGW
jgi:hypothetical protein